MPSYETTATRYTFDGAEEERITCPELSNTQKIIDAFYNDYGNWLKGKKPNGRDIRTPNPQNPSQSLNVNYCFVFEIVKSLIDAHIISDWQLMDILRNDTDIIHVVGKDNTAYTGCLLASEKIAATISAGDNSVRKDKNGNPIIKNGKTVTSGNKTQPAYSPRLHKIKYKNDVYYIFSKIDYDADSNQYLTVDQCRATSVTKATSRRLLYKLVKVLLYDVLDKYKSNVLGMLKELDPKSQEYRDLLFGLNIVVDPALRKLDLIEWKGKDENERRKNFYEDVLTLLSPLPPQAISNPPQRDYFRNMLTTKLKGVYMMLDDRYQSVMDATGIHQMILQGPPGTSKTYGAKSFLAEQMRITKNNNWNSSQLERNMLKSNTDMDGNDIYELPENPVCENVYWDIIQFHPSYTYEDFVRGITVRTPQKNSSPLKGTILQNNKNLYDIELEKNSSLLYKTVNKALGKMAEIARQYEKTEKRFYLIIDEINRANLASVFGELIYALEYRGGKGVSTPYSIEKTANGNTISDNTVIIPENMYIIGTMNTADKSIASIDYAIRRRFLFFPVLPDIKVVYENVGKDINAIELRLFYITKTFFESHYNKEDYNLKDIEIGHSFFLRKSGNKVTPPQGMTIEEYQMKMRYLYQVIPVLKEYINDGMLTLKSKKNDDSDKDDSFKILKEMLDKNADWEVVSKKYDELKQWMDTNATQIEIEIKGLLN